MDKRKVFDIFKFYEVTKKDPCSTQTETIQVQDRPID